MIEPFRIPENQNRHSKQLLAGLALLTSTAMTIAFWPGVGTWEVIQFAVQRKLPVMNDWKSPFIAGIYWVSDDLFESTGPILLLQQILFWSGLALVAQYTFTKLWTRILFFSAVAVLPPIWITEIMLWKEAWTLSFLTLGIGATLAYLRNNRLLFAAIALSSAILLTATRHNTILLAMPTFYVIAQSMVAKASPANENQRRLILMIVLSILVGGALGTTWVLNKRGKQSCHIWHHALLWDLTAISLTEGQVLIPSEFLNTNQAGALAGLEKYFTYYSSDPLFFGKNRPLKLYGTAWSACDERLPLGTLIDSWYDAILNHPGAYLRHRMLYFFNLLGVPFISEPSNARQYYRIDSEFTNKANRCELFEMVRLSPIYKSLAVSFPSQGWLYLSVFILSVWGRFFKTDRTHNYLWCLWFAGTAYFASFIAIGSGAVMRYLVVYAVLGPAILAGRCLTRPHSVRS